VAGLCSPALSGSPPAPEGCLTDVKGGVARWLIVLA